MATDEAVAEMVNSLAEEGRFVASTVKNYVHGLNSIRTVQMYLGVPCGSKLQDVPIVAAAMKKHQVAAADIQMADGGKDAEEVHDSKSLSLVQVAEFTSIIFVVFSGDPSFAFLMLAAALLSKYTGRSKICTCLLNS